MADDPEIQHEAAPDAGPTKANAEVLRETLERTRNDLGVAIEKNKKWFEGWVAGLITDFLPGFGPIQKFAQSRAEYARATNENERQVARERLVIAALEMAFDVGTGGTSAAIPDEILTILNRIKLALKVSKKAQKVPFLGRFVDFFDFSGHVAKLLLKLPGVQRGVDSALGLGLPPAVKRVVGKTRLEVEDVLEEDGS